MSYFVEDFKSFNHDFDIQNKFDVPFDLTINCNYLDELPMHEESNFDNLFFNSPTTHTPLLSFESNAPDASIPQVAFNDSAPAQVIQDNSELILESEIRAELAKIAAEEESVDVISDKQNTSGYIFVQDIKGKSFFSGIKNTIKVRIYSNVLMNVVKGSKSNICKILLDDKEIPLNCFKRIYNHSSEHNYVYDLNITSVTMSLRNSSKKFYKSHDLQILLTHDRILEDIFEITK